MASVRYYVGEKNGKRSIFRSAKTPTQVSHGRDFTYVIGPFSTKLGAEVMANAHGPQIQTVSEAERYAKRIKEGKIQRWW